MRTPIPLHANSQGAVVAQRAAAARASTVQRGVASAGRALDAETQTGFERSFGHSFADIRIHTGPDAQRSATALGAAAYTLGSDIVIGEGDFQPRSSAGRRLLAHELVHSLQQPKTSTGSQRVVVGPVDDAFEREADTIAQTIVAGEPSPATGQHATLLHGGRELEIERGNESGSPSGLPGPGVTTAKLPSDELRLQRTVRRGAPTYSTRNPADIIAAAGLHAASTTLGNTTILVNGAENPSISLPSVSIHTAGSNMSCRFTRAIDISLDHQVQVLSAPGPNGWSADVPIAAVRALGAVARTACRARRADATVRLVVRGRPNDGALATWVHASEDEHVSDNTAAFDQHLVPLHDRVAHHASNDTTVPCSARRGQAPTCDPQACADRIMADVDVDRRVGAFNTQQNASVSSHDRPGGNHHVTVGAQTIDAACQNLTIEVVVPASPPAQPAAPPNRANPPAQPAAPNRANPPAQPAQPKRPTER